MRHIVGLVSLALALSACQPAGDGKIDVTHDPCDVLVLELPLTATAEQRLAVADAASLWNGLIGAQLTLDDVPGAARLPVRWSTAATAFRGFYDDVKGVVTLNDALSGAPLEIVAAHELGHA